MAEGFSNDDDKSFSLCHLEMPAESADAFGGLTRMFWELATALSLEAQHAPSAISNVAPAEG
jgi:hypothetical protein